MTLYNITHILTLGKYEFTLSGTVGVQLFIYFTVVFKYYYLISYFSISTTVIILVL